MESITNLEDQMNKRFKYQDSIQEENKKNFLTLKSELQNLVSELRNS